MRAPWMAILRLKGCAVRVGRALRHRRWFRAPARCRSETGAPRPRAFSPSATRGFAAFGRGAGLKIWCSHRHRPPPAGEVHEADGVCGAFRIDRINVVT